MIPCFHPVFLWRLALNFLFASALATTLTLSGAEPPKQFADPNPVFFNWAFESGSIGKIDKLGDNEFRLHVIGQQDSRGRNRQATWYYFRMENVRGRTLTLHFTDFKGEYNDQPARAPVSGTYRPFFSDDNVHWEQFAELAWDADKDEATVTLRPRGDTVWLAHVPPYPRTRLLKLLEEIDRSPDARVEVIGKSALGNDLHLVTVTDTARPDDAKKILWIIARQHPWETGTSFTVEGALRFIVSEDPAARKLRDENIFKFVPMMNPDGVMRGDSRFNVNGYDTNRQWSVVDLRDKQWLRKMPEIWYVKSRILAEHARKPIDFLLNLHNDEANEYIETAADQEPQLAMLNRFQVLLAAKSIYDPSRPKVTEWKPAAVNSTLVLWPEARVPTALMEHRIVPGKKLGRSATIEDNLAFGAQIPPVMAEAVR
jgi:hypothetical protein